MLNGLITIVTRRQREPETKPPIKGLLPIRTSDLLLTPSARRQRIRKIANLLAFPGEHRRELVDPAIQRLALLVQDLPASEAHHHAGRGGLLDHSLETALYALQRRQGHILPPHAETERVIHEADAWSYAVLALALLHDVGKVVVDQQITLYDADGHRIGLWNVWDGPMNNTAASWYTVRYVPGRSRRLHEPISALLAHQIIPPQGIAWIARHRELLELWAAALHGRLEDAGIIGQLLHQADRESVAQNLGGDRPAPVGAAKQPLGDRMLTTLRYLLREGVLPLNRNGAAGWLQGQDLWLVSKRAADALREQLHEEGFHSVPSRNERLFDVLQEYGVIVPNSEERAIWRARVAGDGWEHELTLLRMAASRIWPDPEQRPSDFDGYINALAPAASDTAQDEEPRSGADAVQDQGSTPEQPPARDTDADAQFSNAAHVESAQDTPKPDSGRPTDAGEAFWSWLTTAIKEGTIRMNTTESRIHSITTDTGEPAVLVVSPGIFQDFGREHGIEWQHVQKRVLKKRLHLKASEGTNIHRYVVKGDRRQGELKGLVFPADAVGSSLPAPNPHIHPMS
ncbi:hypothetical protein CCR79_13145 [Halorhodospira halophila]|nr:MobH family relaxase [Halorhodospira halophila]MBK5944818.1 hypothetical protein [Halorhodospira halophila]